MKLFFFFFLGLISLGLIYPSFAMSWAGITHEFMCLQDRQINCGIADMSEFKRNYPYAEDIGHLCFDNKENCRARLAAKYYLKRYYLEGEKNFDFLGAAAHFWQDASCPDHWYPMRDYFGKIFVPFAPRWVGKTEGLVNIYMRNGQKDWNIPIKYNGKAINIDQAYLDTQKELVASFLVQEPQESLEEIESQIKSANIWFWLRSFKELLMVLTLVFLPVFVYCLWNWQKKKRGLADLIIISISLGIVVILLLAIQLFY